MTRLLVCFCTLLVSVTAQSLLAQELTPDSFSTREAIHARIETVEQELKSLSPAALAKERESLLELEAALHEHLESVAYLQRIVSAAVAARESLSAWNGMSQPPPYSVLLIDQLRSRHQSLQRQQLATESRIRIVIHEVDSTSNQLAASQSATRRLREASETEISSLSRKEALADARAEELRSRILAENVARLRLAHQTQSAQLEAITAELELSTLRLEATENNVVFSKAELDEIINRVAGQRTRLLESLRSRTGHSPAGREPVSWKIQVLDLELNYWNTLFTAMNAEDLQERSQAVETLVALKVKADDWVEIIRLHLSDVADSESEVIGARVTDDDLRLVERLQRRLEFSLEHLEDVGVQGVSLLNRLVGLVWAVWNTELYLAEETASIGGQRVTTLRAVTLGKLIRLAVILTVGWILVGLLSRVMRRTLSRRPGVSESTVESAGQWTFGIGIALLVIIGLNRVHIPFTAFAFLGGTLAIGIGFGAQTILKNFISGLILKLERPFKIGDLVEVGVVKGRITKIGLRASGIRHFDGLDTLVPNSQLLEDRVTNWTYGDTPMRGSISVGVAYGSSLRDTSRALISVARKHGRVLDHPEPEVRLLDFGDNALSFQLLYWFSATHGPVEGLPSDLRFMIGRALDDAGIEIAFPQRDVHFDDSKPLRIELSRPDKGSTPGKAGD